MLIKEIMIKNVIMVVDSESIVKASEMMVENKIGSLVVINKDKRMVGMLTERDILGPVSKSQDLSKLKVADVMTKNIFYVRPDDTVEDAAEIMSENKIKRLPVIENNSLVGIVSAMDVVASEPKFIEKISQLITKQPSGGTGIAG